MATRDASSKAMQGIARTCPGFLGGSADLAPSTKTRLEGLGEFSYEGECGRNLHFGVRENAMVAMLNGMALHGGLRPYGSTFLIFTDYARPAIRLGALMGAQILLVLTHDSIALGEDGPTHQPVEQLVGLRATPGMTVFRPADANETAEAWRLAMARKGPVAFALTRQKLPVLDPGRFPIRGGVPRGGYILSEADGGVPSVVLIGTGSEVHLCLAAQAKLLEQRVPARVVSLVSWELFKEQETDYRRSVLPDGIPRLSVEAASPVGWERWVGADGAILGIDRFGASGPGAEVLADLGFTVARVVETATGLARARGR